MPNGDEMSSTLYFLLSLLILLFYPLCKLPECLLLSLPWCRRVFLYFMTVKEGVCWRLRSCALLSFAILLLLSFRKIFVYLPSCGKFRSALWCLFWWWWWWWCWRWLAISSKLVLSWPFCILCRCLYELVSDEERDEVVVEDKDDDLLRDCDRDGVDDCDEYET